jgi:hypothetical protein
MAASTFWSDIYRFSVLSRSIVCGFDWAYSLEPGNGRRTMTTPYPLLTQEGSHCRTGLALAPLLF